MRIQIWHVVVLIVAFVLLFGWKNLPNIARSMGESMRVFKSEVDQMKDEGQARSEEKRRPALDEDTAMRDYRESQERRPDDRAADQPRPGEPRA